MARTGVPGADPWKPQFFKILLPGFHKRVIIPHQFNKYVTRDNCNVATILSPLGNSWQVDVHGDSNCLYFAEGWEEFCEAHDLSVGCFLVFSYEDDMVFKVTIFDSSACMKEYTPVMEYSDMDNKTRGETISPDAVEISESAEPQNDSHGEQVVGMIKSTVTQEQMAPKEIGSSMKGSFRIPIRSQSFLKPNLHIPRAFQKSSGISGIKKVFLRDPKMRLWPTTVYHRRRSKNVHCRLGYGWTKFCANNNVEEGDVCVFEALPEEENFTIHVNILKKHMLQQSYDVNPFQKRSNVLPSERAPLRGVRENRCWKMVR